jgi:hypothetical protein
MLVAAPQVRVRFQEFSHRLLKRDACRLVLALGITLLKTVLDGVDAIGQKLPGCSCALPRLFKRKVGSRAQAHPSLALIDFVSEKPRLVAVMICRCRPR